MKKVLLILILIFPFNIYALEFPEINSSKAIIYDLTSDELIYEKNSSEKTSIASLTKILSTITALEKINDLDTTITITSPMLNGISYNASVAGLKVGDTITYRDLLYATILPSGADAIQVLAYNVSSGNIPSFINDMNNLALSIGMQNSNFRNTTGLDLANQYSTASDVLILLKYALNNPIFKEVYTTKTYTLTNGLEVKSTLRGYEEHYNIDASRILGSKTGHTTNAGTCLSSYFYLDNHEMLIITMNAPFSTETPYNLLDNLTLIDYLDNNYEIPKTNPTIKEIEEIIIPEEINTSKINNINYEFILFLSIIVLLFIILLLIPHKKQK